MESGLQVCWWGLRDKAFCEKRMWSGVCCGKMNIDHNPQIPHSVKQKKSALIIEQHTEPIQKKNYFFLQFVKGQIEDQIGKVNM